MLWPSSAVCRRQQAFLQLTHYLAFPVAEVPCVCHAASLDWMQEDDHSIYSAGIYVERYTGLAG